VVLINPARQERGAVTADRLAYRQDSLSLLAAAREIFGIGLDVVGEYQPGQFPTELSELVEAIDLAALCLWRDLRFANSLTAADIGVVFIGGAWLEEEVLLAALEGVKLGYDVRLLADLSVGRIEADRSLVLQRLVLHGVPIMTVRQALLEWTSCLQDLALTQRVQQLLS
jgi:hypothetical protein